MKRSAFILALLALFASCDFVSESGSGNIITQKRNISGFTGITVSEAIEAEIKMGSPAVEVEADDNIMKFVVTEVRGNTLHIRLKDGVSLSNTHVKVNVSVLELTYIEANSSATVKVLDVIKSNGKLVFHASSAADIDADVEAPEVEVEASSSGTVKLAGKTKNYTVQVNSAGSAKTKELLAENTRASANSGAVAHVHASVSLDAEANSGGGVKYTGGASVKANTNSGGSVEKEE